MYKINKKVFSWGEGCVEIYLQNLLNEGESGLAIVENSK